MALSPANYLRFCLFGTLLAFALIMPFNYMVDPFGIYHFGPGTQFIRSRPLIYLDDYLHKAHAIEHTQADTLVLGSSRVALGIDPRHAPFSPETYSLALMGSAVYENWRYLQHAGAVHTPHLVVMGIDLEFLSNNRTPPSIFSEDRLLVTADGKPNHGSQWADFAGTMVSFKALQSSFATYRGQGGRQVTDEKGYLGASNRGRVRAAVDVLLDIAKHRTNRIPAFRKGDGVSPQLDYFQNILNYCALHQTRIIIFINPLHAAEIDRQTTYWDDYCAWEKAVVHAVETTPGLNASVWDFCSYSTISTEPPPTSALGESKMKYYEEESHYKANVGDAVIDKILSGAGPAEFGRMVNESNVDADLDRLAREKAAWHERGECVHVEL